MITQDAIDAFNNRLVDVNLNNIKTMKPAEQDRVITHGSNAEALLKNRDLALFVHQFKFSVADQLTTVSGHNEEANNKRVALSNQLAGIDSFIASLKAAVYYKNRVVSLQKGSTDPSENNKETLQW